jgi:hypothetical protein
VFQAQDMTGNLASGPIEIQFKDNPAFHWMWTGTPTGTFAIQVSHDPVNLGWISLPTTGYTQPAGAAGSNFVDFNQTGAAYVQLIYTASSGDGTLYCKFAAKSV